MRSSCLRDRWQRGSRLEERNNKYPKVSKCLGFRQLRLWFFSGRTNVPAFTVLVPRPTKLFYDVFPALSGQGSAMLSPGGNLELRALHDWGVIRQIGGLGCGWEGRVGFTGQKGWWEVPLLAKKGVFIRIFGLLRRQFTSTATLRLCGWWLSSSWR